ncbi:MAG: primosomal protein N' [Parvularculales bacterium]
MMPDAPNYISDSIPDPIKGGGCVRVLPAVAGPGARGLYDYLSSEVLAPGDIVRVPWGMRREVVGVVWTLGAGGEVAAHRLKDVAARPDAPPLTEATRRFVDWVAAYTLAMPGAVLRLVLNTPAALEGQRGDWAYALRETNTDISSIKMTPARRRVLEVLQEGPLSASALAQAAGVSLTVIRGLVSHDVIHRVMIEEAPLPIPDPDHSGVDLSHQQQEAVDVLRCRVLADGFSATVLDGVTGSGKTEVYFEAVATALREGRQGLVLVPEIALTSQFMERFEARFGCAPLCWHSGLGINERRRIWRAVACGEARFVVGARSALFLPWLDLGLIVVDEEHDAAFKQEDGVIYQARDMAVARASLDGFAIVLSSATPSLETLVNSNRGRYGRVILGHRHGGAPPPHIDLVDMRLDPPPSGRWLAPALMEGLEKALASDRQAMVFLNRRGYAPLMLCRKCGYRLVCPDCDAWLVTHRQGSKLQCHHCGHRLRVPDVCPECDAADSLVACGPGVERVAEELTALMPEARLLVMSSDHLRGASAHREALEKITNGEVDIIVGTQLVAKGHHFPRLVFVGVADADLGLANGDLRAAERTYQMLHQVAGRGGREDKPGWALLQTWMPSHPVMEALAAGERENFIRAEWEAREHAALPPFGRLVALVVSGRDEAAVANFAQTLTDTAPQAQGVRVLGPAPAPMAWLRGRHRYRLLVKADLHVKVQAYVQDWFALAKAPSSVRVVVDVDPWSFF